MTLGLLDLASPDGENAPPDVKLPPVLSRSTLKRVKKHLDEHPAAAKSLLDELLPDVDVTRIIGGTVKFERVGEEKPDCSNSANCCLFLAEKCDGMMSGFCPEE